MKTLGGVSSHLLRSLYDADKAIFTIKDVMGIAGKSYNETTDLLSRMVKREVITRLKAGKFLIIPQELGSVEHYIGNWYVTAREIVNSPYYYVGFYSAMQYWGMLTHPVVVIIIATPQRQIVPREMKNKLAFVIVKKQNIWGINKEWVSESEQVRISNIEKTIIDACSHPLYCGGISEIAQGMRLVKDKINYNRLVQYCFRYNKAVVFKRVGYLLDVLSLGTPFLLSKLKEQINNRYDVLDPAMPVKKINSNNWRLIDNVGIEQIKEAQRY